MRPCIGIVLASQERASIRRAAEIEIRPRGLPENKPVLPGVTALERLAHKRKGGGQFADVFPKILLRLVPGGKNNFARLYRRTPAGLQEDPAADPFYLGHFRPLVHAQTPFAALREQAMSQSEGVHLRIAAGQDRGGGLERAPLGKLLRPEKFHVET